ncbi:hypothetical protein K8089_16260 [Aequorivita sp. F47161]|uniref:Uncharacterized protein n=1 Tax=Aequorivita vitellina TaxID=2874475 RepID=A0A9X1R040_9FLAO|nr:hypothetical protein [Aequorivita vitellina]MCG2420577.1 hypothetical protein [Aequorivita vitellina]
MTLIELANKEIDLYSNVMNIYEGKIISDNQELTLEEIQLEYKKVHNEYSKLSDKNIEALKRGLFIQWYALTEPHYLTGINELDEKTERKIIADLKTLIDRNEMDKELMWMLNYYMNWNFVFDRFKDIAEFKKIAKAKIGGKPKIKTDERGQMGIYWKSITAE